MHRAPANAPARLRANRSRYDQVVDVVRHRAGRGDLEGVLRSAMLAGNYGWWSPSGLLADPEIEHLVVDTVRQGGGSPQVDGARDAGRVLHVLSESYVTGGHTRLATRWITRDHRRSDVALTNQRHAVPDSLRAAVEGSGGRLHHLRDEHADLAARSAALRALMDRADVVVQHVHPYDVVALAAANLPGRRPPVIHENHADHTYWLGLAGADVVCDYRASGQRISRELRGVRETRLALLPLPIEEPGEVPADEVRRRLGLGAQEVVALSVADEGKMAPLWGRGFVDLLSGVLSAHPRLKVVVVGPAPAGQWLALAQRFAGRVFPVGRVPDAAPFYAAADIYLSSYPVGSGTAVLEAAAAGLPVLTMQDLGDRHGHARIMQQSPGLAGVEHVVTNDDQYQARLRRLFRDPGARAASGAATRAAVLDGHRGPAWSSALEALYEQARTVPAADLDEYPARLEDPGYGAMLLPLAAPVDRTRDVTELTEPLGDLMDPALLFDLFAAGNRGAGPSLQVRIGRGWEADPSWTRRLLALARSHPRLSVSLPFVAGDDDAATRSVDVLTELLALDGRTTDDCGALSLDAEAPTPSGPAIAGELERTTEALDRLESVLASPCWDEPPAGPVAASRQPALVG